MISTRLWHSPADQGFWAIAVLTCFGVAAAVIRPETDDVVNRNELLGCVVTILAVFLGLAFTEDDADDACTRYVVYFLVFQALYLVGACAESKLLRSLRFGAN